MAIRITCIKKSNGDHENEYVAISHLGWTDYANNKSGISTRLQVYEFIKKGGQAYVLKGSNKTPLIAVETDKGTKYVRTEANSTEKDNLLELSEC